MLCNVMYVCYVMLCMYYAMQCYVCIMLYNVMYVYMLCNVMYVYMLCNVLGCFRVLRVTNLNGLPHSLLRYGHLIPGERACAGRTCLIKKFFQGPSKGRYIPWAVPEDSGYWLNGALRGWSANG